MKLEYQDYYRFLSSVGVAAVVLAVLLMWFVFGGSMVEPLSKTAYDALTVAARESVDRKLEFAAIARQWAPRVAGGLAVIGLVTTIWGLVRWSERQRTSDRKTDAEALVAQLDARLKEIEYIAAREKRETAEAERESERLRDAEASEQTDLSAESGPSPAQEADAGTVPPSEASPSEDRQPLTQGLPPHEAARVFEQIVAAHLETLPDVDAVHREALVHRRIADALVKMRARSGQPDRIVEIKRFHRGIPEGRLRHAIIDTVVEARGYAAKTRRHTRALVVCVAPQASITRFISDERQVSIRDHVEDLLPNAWKGDVEMAFLAEEDVLQGSMKPLDGLFPPRRSLPEAYGINSSDPRSQPGSLVY